MDAERTLAGLVLSTSLPSIQDISSYTSDFMTVTNPHNAFALIDQEILRYADAMRDLKSKRNLLAPVSKLPAEIICNIFMFCSIPDPVTHTTYATDNRWRWITVTQTIHLWRDIALNCPALWSKPEFTKTEWAYEMIKRSKMAPLTIEVNSHYWLTPRVVDAVGEGLKHLSRINEIHISASRDNMDRLLSGINQPAPFLHTLFLDIGRSEHHYHTRPEPYILPDDFLGGDAIRLSHIELSRCYLRWDSLLLHNLTYLKVHNPGPPGPTLNQFIDALAGMSQLEVLDLEHALPGSSDADTLEKPQVSLPQLRRLRAVGHLMECAILLEHVYIPSSTVIQLIAKCSEPPEIGSLTLGLINQVCQRLPVTRDAPASGATARLGNNVPVIKSLLVQSTTTGNGVVVEAWNNLPSNRAKSTPFAIIPPSHESALTLNSFTTATSVGILKLEFTWQSAVMKQLHNEVVVAICRPLPLTQLRNLHIRNGYHKSVSSPTLAKTFGSLPKVNMLTVEGNSVYEFVDALNHIHQGGSSSSISSPDGMVLSPAPAPSPAARPTVAFPALRTLKLLEVDFDRDREEVNTLLQPLMDCLMYRSDLKYEIHKLILERCMHLTAEEVKKLSQIVTDVEWDALEYGYSDSEDEDMDGFDEDMDAISGEYFGYGTAYISSDEDMMFMGVGF